MACRLDCRKAILDKVVDEIMGDKYAESIIRTGVDTIQVNSIAEAPKSMAKNEDKAHAIAREVVGAVRKSFNGHVTGYVEQIGKFDPVTIKFEPSRAYIEHTYNSLPSHKQDEHTLYRLTPQAKLEAAIPELDKYLLDYLKPFGVRSKELDGLKARLGVDALGATDILNKLIWFDKHRDIETVPEEFGHMITFLLGRGHKAIKTLYDNIEDWSEYPTIRDQYLAQYNNSEEQVKIEAIGKLVAKALVKNYKASGTDKTLLDKALEAIKDFFNRIASMGHTTSEDINNYVAEQLAIKILSGEQLVRGKEELVAGREKVDTQKALANDPFANKMINTFTEGTFKDFKVVGSMAIALQGDIYRPANEPIHDLDFKAFGLQPKFKSLQDTIRALGGVARTDGLKNDNSTTYSFIIPKNRDAKIQFTKGHLGATGRMRWATEWTVDGEKGDHTNSMQVDFFWYPQEQKPEEFETPGRWASFNDVFKGKATLAGSNAIMFSREKDQTDYILFKSMELGKSSSNYIYYQLNDAHEELDETEKNYITNNTGPNTHENLMSQRPTISKGIFEKYVTEKQALLNSYYNRLNRTKTEKQKKGISAKDLARLNKLEKELTQAIYGNEVLGVKGLIDEIEDITNASDVGALNWYIEQDLDKIKQLAQSQDIEDLQVAQKLIDFYQEAGQFKFGVDHPFFTQDEIFLSDANGDLTSKYRLPEATMQRFRDWAAKASGENQTELDKRADELLMEMINNSALVRNTFKDAQGNFVPRTKEQVLHEIEGLPDTDPISKLVMDFTSGMFSHNGLIPTVMMAHLAKVTEPLEHHSREISKEMDDMHSDVLKEMSKLDGGAHTLKALGIIGKLGVLKGVSYNLFKDVTSEGNETGTLVNRYTHGYRTVEEEAARMLEEGGRQANLLLLPHLIANFREHLNDEYSSWRREHSIIFDVSKLEEIASDIRFGALGAVGDAAYRDSLIKILGQNGYDEEIERQKELLVEYQADKQGIVESILLKEGKNPGDPLSNAGKIELQNWDNRNSPINGVDHYNSVYGKVIGQRAVKANMNYNHFIPRATKVNITTDVAANVSRMVDTGVPTGYYNDNFKKIEGNPVLLKFYNSVKKALVAQRDVTPYELQQSIPADTLPAMRKSIADILLDKNLGLMQTLSPAFARMLNNIKDGMSVTKPSEISHATDDGVDRNYTVNANFLKNDGRAIESKRRIEESKFKEAWNSTGNRKLKHLAKDTKLELSKFNTAALKLLADYTHTDISLADMKARNLGALEAKVGTNVAIGRILGDYAQHTVVQSQSTDLPKMVKLYTDLTMAYAARQEILPLMELAGKYYKKIQAPEVADTGNRIWNSVKKRFNRAGPRVRGIQQYDSQFKRTFLGETGREEAGLLQQEPKVVSALELQDINKKLAEIDAKIAALDENDPKYKDNLNELQDKKYEQYSRKHIKEWGTTLYTRVEQLKIGELQERIENEPDQAVVEKMKEEQQAMGRLIAWSKISDVSLMFINMLKLGWNVPSMIGNFMSGIVANQRLAATEEYFDSRELSYGYMVMRLSFIKNLFGKLGWQPSLARLARTLADRFNMVVDSRNILQKSSHKSIGGMFEFLSWGAGNQRVEYMNQVPIMISMLRTLKIKSMDGTKESKVWNAFDRKTGKLKPEYRSEENISNWEKLDGEQYTIFKANLDNAIVRGHGNYSHTRGMMIKEKWWGRALMGFKSWLPEAFGSRWSNKRDDIQSGIKDYQGDYRSYSKTGAAFHGAVVATAMGGWGIGVPIGLIAGPFIARFANSGVDPGVGVIRQLIDMGWVLSKRMIGMPINIPSSILFGKRVISSGDKAFENWIPNSKGKFTEQNAAAMRANMADLSMQLAYLALALIVKHIAWDDDDDDVRQKLQADEHLKARIPNEQARNIVIEDFIKKHPTDYANSAKRWWHNVIINKLMQLSSESAMYVDPKEIQNSTVGNIGMIQTYDDIRKEWTAIQKALDGHDMLRTGESRLGKQSEKLFLPGLFKNPLQLGFESQGERVFKESPWHELFKSHWAKDKEYVDAHRTQRRNELENNEVFKRNVPDDVARGKLIDKIVDIELPTSAKLKKYGFKDREQYETKILKKIK